MKFYIGILFFFVLACTKDDSNTNDIALQASTPAPQEINVETLPSIDDASRSGIVLQAIDFPASGSRYNYLTGTISHAIDNPSQIDSSVYVRWNPNHANFSSFLGSNYIKTIYYKSGQIKNDSIITSIAYGPKFTVKTPSHPILKPGMSGKVYSWVKTLGTDKSYLQYRGESVALIIWSHRIDNVIKETRSKPPDTSISKQWQPKHIM
jgi:hypothetical protein